MVELADTPDLGSGAVRRTGSSPAIRTTTEPTVDIMVNCRFVIFYPKTALCQGFGALLCTAKNKASLHIFASGSISTQYRKKARSLGNFPVSEPFCIYSVFYSVFESESCRLPVLTVT